MKHTIRSACYEDLPLLLNIGQSAFTTFTAFGPPWFDDAALLPGMLVSMPGADLRFLRICDESAYAVWTKYEVQVGGSTINGLNLAPLAVRADLQASGLGSLLMEDGIQLAQESDIDLMFILGHETYYPRFGFTGKTMGRSGYIVPLNGYSPCSNEICGMDGEFRPVRHGDGNRLQELWMLCNGADDGLIRPKNTLTWWLSGTRDIVAAVWAPHGPIRAYARFDARHGADPKALLLAFAADSVESAQAMLGFILSKIKLTELVLPLGQQAAQKLGFAELETYNSAWDAGMTRILRDPTLADGSRLTEHLGQVQAEQRPAWNLGYPPIFDF